MKRAKKTAGWAELLAVATVVSLLGACSSRDGDLEEFIAATKKESGDRVEPLREFQPYESYAYAAGDKRSPFVPGSSAGVNSGLRPQSARNREFLEQFALDTLRMVGTLSRGNQSYALVQVRDGRVQRVSVGNYMGQNDGRVTDIADNKITLTEVVADGLGGYIERPAAIALNE